MNPLLKLLRAFRTGFAGIGYGFWAEQNMKLHCVAAVVVVAAGCWFQIAAWEWAAVALCIGLVISAECLNTAVERLADRVSRETDPLIKHAKDSASAGVLVIVLASCVVGGIVFGPRLWRAAGW